MKIRKLCCVSLSFPPVYAQTNHRTRTDQSRHAQNNCRTHRPLVARTDQSSHARTNRHTHRPIVARTHTCTHARTCCRLPIPARRPVRPRELWSSVGTPLSRPLSPPSITHTRQRANARRHTLVGRDKTKDADVRNANR